MQVSAERANHLRTSADGKPFYCLACGLGWQEYSLCESANCVLEPEDQAKRRQSKEGGNK